MDKFIVYLTIWQNDVFMNQTCQDYDLHANLNNLTDWAITINYTDQTSKKHSSWILIPFLSK